MTVTGGAVVPVLINIKIPYIDVLSTLIILTVFVLISLESVFHFRERWKNYRSTEQLLQKEYFEYVSGEGPYKGLDNSKQKEAFLKFVERVENAIASENSSTLNVMTTVTERKAEPDVVKPQPPIKP